MFNSGSGLYFEREDNGDVTIMQLYDNGEMSDPFGPHFTMKETLSADLWASIVSSVSAAGEENLRWYKAKTFHMEPGENITSAPLD